MSGHGESGIGRGAVGVAEQETSYEAYASARERFFDGLRRDAEIRRLERAWRLPSAGSAPGGREVGR